MLPVHANTWALQLPSPSMAARATAGAAARQHSCKVRLSAQQAHLNPLRPAKLLGHGQDGNAHTYAVHVADQQGQGCWAHHSGKDIACIHVSRVAGACHQESTEALGHTSGCRALTAIPSCNLHLELAPALGMFVPCRQLMILPCKNCVQVETTECQPLVVWHSNQTDLHGE